MRSGRPRQSACTLLLADLHADPINALSTAGQKAAYAAGMVDAQVVLEADIKAEGGTG